VLVDRWQVTPSCYEVRFRVGDDLPQPEPGQFVMVRPAVGEEPFWRRAYSVADFRHDGSGAVFDLMIKVVGVGTAVWSRLPIGTEALVLGPLGNGFRRPLAGARIALVAGGIGLPPLYYAARFLAESDVRCDLFQAASTASELMTPERTAAAVAATGGEIELVTDDGSAGSAGLAPEVVDARLRAGSSWDEVWACGPVAMLAALAAVAREHGVRAQFAMEEHMACGVGVCLGCVVATHEGHVRVCREGPVLDPRTIDWEAVR
jgi:dihydroorotate dehydrogenase electron transfer subunit